jgi:hypothetical protein
VRGVAAIFEQRVEPVVVDLELELLVDAVDEFVMDRRAADAFLTAHAADLGAATETGWEKDAPARGHQADTAAAPAPGSR